MFDLESVVFRGAAFLTGIVLLQYGSIAFIDNIAIVAHRIGVPDTLISLFTAGAEWEELVVVIATILQHQPTLGLGNVIGSCIGNVLGAFSLGLLAYGGPMEFDQTAKIYASAQLVITTVFVIFSHWGLFDLFGGIFFLVGFFVYLFSVGEGIYEGFITPPQRDAVVEEEIIVDVEQGSAIPPGEVSTVDDYAELHVVIHPTVMHCHPSESTPLIKRRTTLMPNDSADERSTPLLTDRQRRSTFNHIFMFLFGFIAICISGFVLAQSTSALAEILHVSNTVVGMTILSFATTLPEKFVSVRSGMRGRPGMVVASTAGCNIFLITLCLGTIFVAGGDRGNEITAGSINKFEVWSCWGCSLLLTVITWIGGRPWMGGILLGLYLGFLGSEFTFYRR